jgi:F-type H+-transporting ATPase subunit epsilon
MLFELTSPEPALPLEERTRDRLDEIVRLETPRDGKARREADFALSRLEQVRTSLSF